MKPLLILLSTIAILGAVFAGGCSVLSVGNYLWYGPRGEYPDLQRGIAWISAGVGLVAAAVFTANMWAIRTLVGRPPRGRWLACALAVMDVATAVAALAWVVWADGWHWADWPRSSLAKAAAGLLAVKGVLIWRLVGRPTAVDASDSGHP